MNALATTAWDGRDVLALLAVAPVGPGLYRSGVDEANENGRIFGGQLMGQAVMAAAATAPDDRPVTHLQFLFAAGGLPGQAVDYAVAPLQDGKRFTARAVRGEQPGGRIVCSASVTFARPIEGPAHETPAPADCGLDVDPEGLPPFWRTDAAIVREVERTLSYTFRPHPAIDLRAPFPGDWLGADPVRPRMRFWIRRRGAVGGGLAGEAAAFAYLSDFWINYVACAAHVRTMAARDTRLYVASLNHVLWIHRPLRVDEWLLFDCVSPVGDFGRGLATASVYARSGALVASAAQECLLAPSG